MKILMTVVALIISSVSQAEICAYDDDRIASNDASVARATYRFDPTATSRNTCTITMVSKTCFVNSGLCGRFGEYAEFKVPASINGEPQKSSSSDFYYIDPHSVVSSGSNVATGEI